MHPLTPEKEASPLPPFQIGLVRPGVSHPSLHSPRGAEDMGSCCGGGDMAGALSLPQADVLFTALPDTVSAGSVQRKCWRYD
jgi:hypothetical protein